MTIRRSVLLLAPIIALLIATSLLTTRTHSSPISGVPSVTPEAGVADSTMPGAETTGA